MVYEGCEGETNHQSEIRLIPWPFTCRAVADIHVRYRIDTRSRPVSPLSLLRTSHSRIMHMSSMSRTSTESQATERTAGVCRG